MSETRRYQIRGIVQGVGFRPFIFRTATRLELSGWIRNDSDGVVLEVQGQSTRLEEFILEVHSDAPALARIDEVSLLECREDDEPMTGFEIHESERAASAQTLVSADTCVCADCLRELLDPADRRYGYPFINCTNCGPRYSIIRGVPYDRAMTTMSSFPMCAACAAEYRDITDRRFHAQPVACWDCGPRVELLDTHGRHLAGGPAARETPEARGAPIVTATRMLREGAILAVKGIGGYHLMVDARNAQAVAELRRRKRREEKPFALMSATLAAVSSYAVVEDEEARLLGATARPIVLVRKRAGAELAEGIAPGNHHYGVMLAYTPLHHLLLAGFDALVATSGNVSDEPIAFTNEDALERLASIADAFLVNDRDIYTRVDDSIVRVVRYGEQVAVSPLRRARGYTPEPVRAPFEAPPLLAVGPELKSTICISRGRELFLSHHIGDLKNEATMRSFEHAIEHLSRLLEVQPGLLAHDAHPGYLSTRFAREQEELPTIAIQHHHAHMAACMCEHGLSEPVIGVIFDGTGYGIDGNVWGGEILVGDYAGFERAAHLDYFHLPGGDKAVKEPFRVALSLLRDATGCALADIDLPVTRARSEEELHVLDRMIETGVRSPLTSSMGRLFDGVAALLGVREHCHYEAQAAIELEQLIPRAPANVREGSGPHERAPTGQPTAAAEYQDAPPLEWELHVEEWPMRIGVGPLVLELGNEIAAGRASVAELSLRFHRTIVEIVRETCVRVARRTGLERVVLSGGVFQNEYLLRGAFAALREAGFEVHAHRLVPANDGGVALGQAAIAGWVAQHGDERSAR